MSDSLSERLKRLAEQDKAQRQEEQSTASFQQRVHDFISNNATPEFNRLQSLLKTRVDEINPTLGTDLAQFRYNTGSRMLEQGNAVAVVHFDKPIMNLPNNALLLSFGPHPNAMYFDDPPPSNRYRLQAAASDSVDQIVWVGDLGELTTEQLVDFIIESLTTYYLQHKPSR